MDARGALRHEITDVFMVTSKLDLTAVRSFKIFSRGSQRPYLERNIKKKGEKANQRSSIQGFQKVCFIRQ